MGYTDFRRFHDKLQWLSCACISKRCRIQVLFWLWDFIVIFNFLFIAITRQRPCFLCHSSYLACVHRLYVYEVICEDWGRGWGCHNLYTYILRHDNLSIGILGQYITITRFVTKPDIIVGSQSHEVFVACAMIISNTTDIYTIQSIDYAPPCLRFVSKVLSIEMPAVNDNEFNSLRPNDAYVRQ